MANEHYPDAPSLEFSNDSDSDCYIIDSGRRKKIGTLMKVTMRVMMIMCLIRVMLLVKTKVKLMGYLLYEIGKIFCIS